MQEIDGLTFQTEPNESVTVTCANQMTLVLNGVPANSPVSAPAAGQSALTVMVFFLPGGPDATVTFSGSLGGSFVRTFHKPANDDFQGTRFTLKTS